MCLVEAGAAERRRIERNLHDGAQQRLVSVAFALGLARSRLPTDLPAAGTALAEAQSGLAQALDELRRLGQGIHPGVLVERGLRAAIIELAWTAPVPVHLQWDGPERLPEPVELAGYYVVAEAVTNAAKHACATRARVRVSKQDLSPASCATRVPSRNQRMTRYLAFCRGGGSGDRLRGSPSFLRKQVAAPTAGAIRYDPAVGTVAT